jgi:predicted phage terminase large subunit-like protein
MLSSVATLEQALRERAHEAIQEQVDSFAPFLRSGWHVLHPTTPLDWNWHLDAISEHLGAVVSGQIRRLLITIPPGHLKSMSISVYFPAWRWLSRPDWSLLCGSHDLKLAARDSGRCRDLITSDWYQHTFAPPWCLRMSRNAVLAYGNTERGERMCISVGSGTLGRRGDCLMIDDPHNPKQHILSESDKKRAREWFGSVAGNRLNDLRSDPIILIMQRLAHGDLADVVKEMGGWEELRLPSRFRPEKRCITTIGWSDPRTEDGELLFEERFPDEVLVEQEKLLLPSGFSAKHQQDPQAEGGAIIHEEWIRYYDERPERFDRTIQSIDLSGGGQSETSSRGCIELWGALGADRYLIDEVRGLWEIDESVGWIRACAAGDVPLRDPALQALWRQAPKIYLENKALGAAAYQTLKKEFGPRLVKVDPCKSKLERLASVAYVAFGGNLLVPKRPAWVRGHEGWVHEVTRFPGARFNDRPDTMSQALDRLREKRGAYSVEEVFL